MDCCNVSLYEFDLNVKIDRQKRLNDRSPEKKLVKILFLLLILWAQVIKRAGADVGLMFIAYNLKRVMNILLGDELREYLRILASLFLTITAFFRRKISRLGTFLFQDIICPVQIQLSLKSQ